jgi:hypothetical protein
MINMDRQHFQISGDLDRHIMNDHRISNMRCPSCLKEFKSCTALVAHCESTSTKCRISKAEDYGLFLDRLTGGFITVDERIRPEFIENPPVELHNSVTNRKETFQPLTARYLQYTATTPSDFKGFNGPDTITIGAQPTLIRLGATEN